MRDGIVRLNVNDYDETLDFLNLVFSMHSQPHDFTKLLPVMCQRDEEHMRKYLAVRRDGRIRALLGVYPLPVRVGEKQLLWSTVGNVATHPYEEGKGYMSMLLDEAMNELERIGADGSRLLGLRQRYNRYGYEAAGTKYTFIFTTHNALRWQHEPEKIRFAPILADDGKTLAFVRKLYENQGMAVHRMGDKDFYLTLIAQRNQPFIAYNDQDEPIGYLTQTGNTVAEQGALSPELLLKMLEAWLAFRSMQSINFMLAPWQADEIRFCLRICEKWSIFCPSLFKVCRWAETVDAFLALKASCMRLPEGRCVIHIQGYGAIELVVEKAAAYCTKTDKRADISLDVLSATRMIFGPLPFDCAASVNSDTEMLMYSWFPLPLSWSALDRV